MSNSFCPAIVLSMNIWTYTRQRYRIYIEPTVREIMAPITVGFFLPVPKKTYWIYVIHCPYLFAGCSIYFVCEIVTWAGCMKTLRKTHIQYIYIVADSGTGLPVLSSLINSFITSPSESRTEYGSYFVGSRIPDAYFIASLGHVI